MLLWHDEPVVGRKFVHWTVGTLYIIITFLVLWYKRDKSYKIYSLELLLLNKIRFQWFKIEILLDLLQCFRILGYLSKFNYKCQSLLHVALLAEYFANVKANCFCLEEIIIQFRVVNLKETFSSGNKRKRKFHQLWLVITLKKYTLFINALSNKCYV